MKSIVKSRLSVIFFFFVSIYCLVLSYLFYLQVLRHSFFIDLAHQQYYFTSQTAPIRGIIYDRYGHPLVLNKEGLAAFVIPKHVDESPQLVSFLNRYFPESVDRLRKNHSANFMYIKRRLTETEITLIEESEISDIKLLAEPSRFYPIESTAQIVGITNIDNVGQSGIEYICDEQLAGAPTTICLSKDARSGYYYFSKECTQRGKQGEKIHLTLDADLQFLMVEELKETVATFSAQEAAAIIIDPATGDILAMGSYPFCDPNDTRRIALESTKNQ